MTETSQIADEVKELATVDEAHIHDDDQLAVMFNTNSVIDAFQEKMLSKGFAVAQMDGTSSNGMVAIYRRITEF